MNRKDITKLKLEIKDLVNKSEELKKRLLFAQYYYGEISDLPEHLLVEYNKFKDTIDKKIVISKKRKENVELDKQCVIESIIDDKILKSIIDYMNNKKFIYLGSYRYKEFYKNKYGKKSKKHIYSFSGDSGRGFKWVITIDNELKSIISSRIELNTNPYIDYYYEDDHFTFNVKNTDSIDKIMKELREIAFNKEVNNG